MTQPYEQPKAGRQTPTHRTIDKLTRRFRLSGDRRPDYAALRSDYLDIYMRGPASIKQLAEKCGVSSKTMHRWMAPIVDQVVARRLDRLEPMSASDALADDDLWGLARLCHWRRRMPEQRERAIRLIHRIYIDQQIPLEILARRIEWDFSGLAKAFKSLDLTLRPARHRTAYAERPTGAYAVDPTALDDLMLDHVAYLYGYLWADGAVKYCGNQPSGIVVTAQLGDVAHLRKLAFLLGYDGPIRTATRQLKGKLHATRVLAVWSERLATRACELRLACRDGGRSNITPPADLPVNWAAFYRGFVDGDGGLLRDKRCAKPCSGWSVILCGSHAMMSAYGAYIEGILTDHYGIAPDEYSHPIALNGRSVINHRLTVRGPAAMALADHLWPASGQVALKRKSVVAQTMRDASRAAEALGQEMYRQRSSKGTQLHLRTNREANAAAAKIFDRLPRALWTKNFKPS